jgi:hypothetical protein
MGYEGERLSDPNKIEGKLETFSYVNGDVIQYKVINEGHGASGAISEKISARLPGRRWGRKRSEVGSIPAGQCALAIAGRWELALRFYFSAMGQPDELACTAMSLYGSMMETLTSAMRA